MQCGLDCKHIVWFTAAVDMLLKKLSKLNKKRTSKTAT